MSFHPFDGQLVPFGYDLSLLDREADLWNLDSLCAEPRILNYRYICPRGMGKSTLLDTYFSFEKCQELAQQKKLVCLCRFSGDEMRTDADVFVRLIEAVKESLENLDMDSRDYQLLSRGLRQKEEACPDYRTDPNKGEELLKEMLTFLEGRRYHVTLVLDEFHQLACAGDLADATFSKMAAIGQKKLISYIVASDYDDEVGSETYYMSPFSRIFANGTSHLEGISSPAGKRALAALVRSKLTRFPDMVFTDGELQLLMNLTGGIPGLIKAALKDIFEIKQEMNCELEPQQLTQYALSACTPLMEKWVQYFDDARWETMAAVLDGVSAAAISSRLTKEQDRLTSLTNAGLVVKNIRRQEYHPVCPLFAQYIRNELPRRTQKETPALPGLGLGNQPGTVIHIEKYVHGNDHSQTLKAENVQIQNGLSVSEVLHILEDGAGDTRELFAARLSEQLRRYIPAGGLTMRPRAEFATEEAYQQCYDEAFDAMSKKVVQDVDVDEEMELAVTPAELRTLDERFEDARRRCRPDLPDSLLEEQSDRCQFYLKLSVVVEDALDLPGIQMEDYSPQLVLYGKALEQALRDNFYELFHKDPTLSVYDTYENVVDPTSDNVFANKKESKTMIGGYTHLILAQRAYLTGLCQKHPVRLAGAPADANGWMNWWLRLQSDVYSARDIRNLADHADAVSPDRNSLNAMCDKLFGTAAVMGVLPRMVVGRQLCRSLFPPQISFDVVQKFEGQTCQVLCTEVKRNGGIKSETLDGGYLVKISGKRADAFRQANGCESIQLSGRKLTVKILEFKTQDGQEYFAGELVGIETPATVL